jgi:hypothetical protein
MRRTPQTLDCVSGTAASREYHLIVILARPLAKTFIHDHLPTMDFCEHPALKRLHGAMRLGKL